MSGLGAQNVALPRVGYDLVPGLRQGGRRRQPDKGERKRG